MQSQVLMNFINWNVMIDIGFWSRLTKKKIQEYKLDQLAKPLTCKFRLSNKPDKLSILSIDAYSFSDTLEEDKSGPIQFKIIGQFLNTNTVEEFNNFNVEEQQDKMMKKQLKNIQRLIAGDNLIHVMEIFLLIFGDLKRYTFKYQFLSSAIPVQNYSISKIDKIEDHIDELNNYVKHFNGQLPQFTVLFNYKLSSLKQFINTPKTEEFLFCIADTSNYPKATGYHTSTLLSVFAYLIQQKIVSGENLKNVRILLMKQFLIYNLQNAYTFKNSQIITMDLSNIKIGKFVDRIQHPKKVLELDLKSFMDDRSLIKEAVDLNIKLMKWRLLPSLNIPKIQSKKCLLFGAGTLGCQLARNLIGWGIKNISFVDYSRVSYSNPVRQTLYDFQDTKDGGKPKAQTAANKLIQIYPQITSKGYKIEIPMPGHYVTKQQHIKQTFQSINLIEKLISQHDVIFLLLDSRQARWLPTVLANKYDKACITVGLGFDSFVIVRHGVSPKVFQPDKHRQRICCYFCNDIITPQNTMKDRTLDQMCTVTRPGLSFVASAYASELYISMIHHPLQHHAPANQNQQKLQVTDLGRLPHHIRGNMSDFQTNIFYGRAFDQCVACSNYILQEYENNRDQFMLKVLNDPSFIHHVVKLQEQLAKFKDMQCNIIQILDDDMGQIQVIGNIESLKQGQEKQVVQEEVQKPKLTQNIEEDKMQQTSSENLTHQTK